MFGSGLPNTPGRNLRLFGIVGLLVVGLLFHNAGGNTSSARTVRIAIFGITAAAIALSGPRRGITIRGAGSAQAGASSAADSSGNPAQPGWYPLPGQVQVQRYWDGATWGQRRRWNGKTWMLD